MNALRHLPRLAQGLAVLWLALLLTACAGLRAGGSVGPGAAPAPDAAASASGAASGVSGSGFTAKPVSAGAGAAGAAGAAAPRPFADVIKDAKPVAGLFTVWQKDDKFWLELKPSDLNQPFFLSPKLKTGIGEGRFFGGLVGEDLGIEFRLGHNPNRKLAGHTQFRPGRGTPNGR